jgi:hypothetical protein
MLLRNWILAYHIIFVLYCFQYAGTEYFKVQGWKFQPRESLPLRGIGLNELPLAVKKKQLISANNWEFHNARFHDFATAFFYLGLCILVGLPSSGLIRVPLERRIYRTTLGCGFIHVCTSVIGFSEFLELNDCHMLLSDILYKLLLQLNIQPECFFCFSGCHRNKVTLRRIATMYYDGVLCTNHLSTVTSRTTSRRPISNFYNEETDAVYDDFFGLQFDTLHEWLYVAHLSVDLSLCGNIWLRFVIVRDGHCIWTHYFWLFCGCVSYKNHLALGVTVGNGCRCWPEELRIPSVKELVLYLASLYSAFNRFNHLAFLNLLSLICVTGHNDRSHQWRFHLQFRQLSSTILQICPRWTW